MNNRDLEDVTQRCMEVIDREGAPENITKTDWIELLESIVSECESRAEAAREELAAEKRRQR